MKPIEVSDEVVDVIELFLRREGETVADVIARLIGDEARRRWVSVMALTTGAADMAPRSPSSACDEHQTGFAFGEALAHVNHMLDLSQLVLENGADWVDRYRTGELLVAAQIGDHLAIVR